MMITRGTTLGALALALSFFASANAFAKDPKVSIKNATASESETLEFRVKADSKAKKTIKIDYIVETGTAGVDDLTPGSGIVKISKGKTMTTVSVATLDDEVAEETETFSVELTRATNAKIVNERATGTVEDDDEDTGPPAGALVITEFMANPNDVPDASGEWIEILNVSVDTVNLAGVEVHTGGTLRCTLAARWRLARSGSRQPRPGRAGRRELSAADCRQHRWVHQPRAQRDSPRHPVYTSTTAGRSASLDPDFASVAGNDLRGELLPRDGSVSSRWSGSGHSWDP